MISVNSAIEVDLTGQVCADSIGPQFYSGIGGQVDFVRGAARSRGGKPVIALPSTAKDDEISRIVPQLKPGAGVVTSRGDVHYVVTEYGVAALHGKSIRERAQALINIAHPKFRDELEAYAMGQHWW
jgi:acyl-CoA hydrolase